MRRTIQSVVSAWAFLVGFAQAVPSPDATGYCWTVLPPLRTPRQEHGAAAVGKKFYVIGGFVGKSPTNTIEIFDVEKNTWSEGVPLPEAYHHANIAAVDGKIYVLGGVNRARGWQSNPRSFRFDPEQPARGWEELAPFPNARGSATVGDDGTTIWLVGGMQTKADANSSSVGSASMRILDALSSYDTLTNKWTSHDATSLPEVRDHGGGAVVGGIFYVTAGRQGAQSSTRDTVYALDLKSRTKFTTMTPMPSKRGGIGVAAVGNKIFVFGGEGNAASPKGVFPNVEVYETSTNAWAVDPPMAHPRHGFGLAAINDTIYIAGGGAKQGMDESLDLFEAYGPCRPH